MPIRVKSTYWKGSRKTVVVERKKIVTQENEEISFEYLDLRYDGLAYDNGEQENIIEEISEPTKTPWVEK